MGLGFLEDAWDFATGVVEGGAEIVDDAVDAVGEVIWEDLGGEEAAEWIWDDVIMKAIEDYLEFGGTENDGPDTEQYDSGGGRHGSLSSGLSVADSFWSLDDSVLSLNDSFPVFYWPNTAPEVWAADQSLDGNEWRQVSDWFGVADMDGDAMTQYRFWDSGAEATSGYFWTPDNAHHAADTAITVNAADLGNVWFRGGQTDGTETLWVQAFDGSDWSEWRPFNVATNANVAPEVSAADHSLESNEWHQASDWFGVADADGDAMTQYRFWDSGADASSGYFWTPDNWHHAADTAITVDAADLGNVWFRGGQASGTETLWVQAFDGSDWSEWRPFNVTTNGRIVGTEGNDVLAGGLGVDTILALGGDDELIGKGGADVLDGGAGVDTASYAASPAGVAVNLAAGTGYGGDADGDTLIGIEHAIGSAFDDGFQGGAKHGKFLAGDGDDTMFGGSLYDWLEGGNGNDTFVGTGGFMVMLGGDGDDRMTGSVDNGNYFEGGMGNDVMQGGNTTDYMADVTGGDDIMHGGAGDESMTDFYGVAELYGEAGNDYMVAALGSGLLDGGAGNDSLYVSNGDYTLIGGAGNDTFEFAGFGTATFTGGEGADVYTYRVLAGGGNYTVTDFQDGVDKIFLWDNRHYGTVPLESLTIADSAAGAVIGWNGASEMVLAGIQANQLTQSDFAF